MDRILDIYVDGSETLLETTVTGVFFDEMTQGFMVEIDINNIAEFYGDECYAHAYEYGRFLLSKRESIPPQHEPSKAD